MGFLDAKLLLKIRQGERWTDRLGRFFIFCFLLNFSCVTRCPGSIIEAPYVSPPSVPQLLEAAKPKVTSLQVPLAKIRINRFPSANLMFLAQQPGRFSGQVQIAGKELLSLALHEEGYALRYLATKGPAPGFYEGSFSDCVTQQVLGVSIAKEDLLTVLLGGIPVPPSPFLQIKQHWDQRRGQEIILIKTDTVEQEIGFSWLHGTWVPVFGTQRRFVHGRFEQTWTIVHENFRSVDKIMLPQKTTIIRSEEARKQRFVISYHEQIPEPSFLNQYQNKLKDNLWDDDEGWENEEPETNSISSPEDTLTESPIPAPFILKRSDLKYRGELCTHHSFHPPRARNSNKENLTSKLKSKLI